MSKDPMTIWFDIGRQTIAAQQAQAKAMREAMTTLGKAVDAQKAMARAAETNLAAMNGWMALWGIK